MVLSSLEKSLSHCEKPSANASAISLLTFRSEWAASRISKPLFIKHPTFKMNLYSFYYQRMYPSTVFPFYPVSCKVAPVILGDGIPSFKKGTRVLNSNSKAPGHSTSLLNCTIQSKNSGIKKSKG